MQPVAVEEAVAAHSSEPSEAPRASEAVAEADSLALKITTVVLALLLAFLLNKSLLLEEPHTP